MSPAARVIAAATSEKDRPHDILHAGDGQGARQRLAVGDRVLLRLGTHCVDYMGVAIGSIEERMHGRRG
jgi:hypothetical protein